MATFPALYVEAPTRTVRSSRLLDVVEINEVAEHLTQIEYTPDTCLPPRQLPDECYVTVGTAEASKTIDGILGPVTAPTFGVYAGVACWLNGGIEQLRDSARRRLELGESHVVEQYFASLAATLGTALPAATSIAGAIAALEQAIANNVAGTGIIHLSPTTATLAASQNLLIRDPLTSSLSTILGTPVVVGSGYPASAAYASGLVTVWRGPIVESEAPEIIRNKAHFLAERVYALAVECGISRITLPTSPFQQDPPPTSTLTLALGVNPGPPIPAGDEFTLEVDLSRSSTEDVLLYRRTEPGGADWFVADMTKSTSTEYLQDYDTDAIPAGTTLYFVAKSEGQESNEIAVEVV